MDARAEGHLLDRWRSEINRYAHRHNDDMLAIERVRVYPHLACLEASQWCKKDLCLVRVL